jgi:predicted amidohydrolase
MLRVTAVSFCLGNSKISTIALWEKHLTEMLTESLSKSSVVLLPELFWLDLARLLPPMTQKKLMAEISDLVWNLFIPKLQIQLAQEKKPFLLVLGTAPRQQQGKFFNSAPILMNKKFIVQDKIYLTPWEKTFTSGKKLHCFSFQKLNVVVPICYDIEHPYYAEQLKQAQVDLLLVPSATETRLGNERVLRCASARGVELGCAVVSVPLIGKSQCNMVDQNVGAQGFFLPSQVGMEAYQSQLSIYSTYETEVEVRATYDLPVDWLKQLKKSNRTHETRPFLKKNPAFHLQLH